MQLFPPGLADKAGTTTCEYLHAQCTYVHESTMAIFLRIAVVARLGTVGKYVRHGVVCLPFSRNKMTHPK